MTRELGIKYIWIDSLCIIQDDIDDWDKQSALMKDVYGHSYLTIAATASKNGSGGLFVQPKAKTHLVSLQNSKGYRGNLNVHYRPSVANIGCRRMNGRRDRVGLSPLPRRAWAYQGKMLSPRVVQYTSEELVWECDTMKTCECGLEPYIDAEEKRSFSIVKRYMEDRAKLPSEDFLTTTWHRTIPRYANLTLTYPSDRLPAFSGIAGVFVDPRQYIAGLRKDHLSVDLGWSTEGGWAQRIREYIAPSWSWAALDGYVHYDIIEGGGEYLLLISVVDTLCTVAGPDPFGKILDGHLIVEGYIAHATLAECKEVQLLNEQSMWKSYWREFIPDCISQVEYEDDETKMLCLFIHGFTRQRSFVQKSVTYKALVLMNISQDDLPVYSRVGTITTHPMRYPIVDGHCNWKVALAAKFEWRRVKII